MVKNKKYGFALFGAYILWSILPFYIKIFADVSPYEILAHRLFWAFLSLLLFFLFWKRKSFLQFWKKLSLRSFLFLAFSGSCISINWLAYVYSINAGILLQSSLGYFISPLLSMLMGWVILKEKISKLQFFSIFLSAVGVFYLIFFYNEIPWIALILAVTFGLYSIIHKKINLEAGFAFFVETFFLLPLTLGYLFLLAYQKKLYFLAHTWQYDLGLVFLGIISSVPLILFSYSLRGLSFLLLGFIQFYLPSVLFLFSVFLFGEDFGTEYRITFFFIWAAVLLFIFNHYQKAHKKRKTKKRDALRHC